MTNGAALALMRRLIDAVDRLPPRLVPRRPQRTRRKFRQALGAVEEIARRVSEWERALRPDDPPLPWLLKQYFELLRYAIRITDVLRQSTHPAARDLLAVVGEANNEYDVLVTASALGGYDGQRSLPRTRALLHAGCTPGKWSYRL